MEDERKRELVADWRRTAETYDRHAAVLRDEGDSRFAEKVEQAATDARCAADLLEISIASTDERKGEVCPAQS